MEAVEKFFVQNFGCRATQADGAALESLLSAKGLEAADRTQPRRPGGPEHLHGHFRGG